MRIGTEICFRLARRRVLGRRVGEAGEHSATFDVDAYGDWRSSELESQLRSFVPPTALRDRDVLDFGCGRGELSFIIAADRPRSIVGIDLFDVDIEEGIAAAARNRDDLPVMPRFEVGRSDRIDLPDASVDDILCFDVVEHILDPVAILGEWQRILRPGGSIYIWWIPWLHPWGHHVESLVPIPWAHVVFSDRSIIETCARIYDHPQFEPRLWDLDDDGAKRPNKWKTMTTLPEVNRLTIRQFEKRLAETRLRIAERRLHGFSSSGIKRASGLLTRIPFVREFFTGFVTYRLERD